MVDFDKILLILLFLTVYSKLFFLDIRKIVLMDGYEEIVKMLSFSM